MVEGHNIQQPVEAEKHGADQIEQNSSKAAAARSQNDYLDTLFAGRKSGLKPSELAFANQVSTVGKSGAGVTVTADKLDASRKNARGTLSDIPSPWARTHNDIAIKNKARDGQAREITKEKKAISPEKTKSPTSSAESTRPAAGLGLLGRLVQNLAKAKTETANGQDSARTAGYQSSTSRQKWDKEAYIARLKAKKSGATDHGSEAKTMNEPKPVTPREKMLIIPPELVKKPANPQLDEGRLVCELYRDFPIKSAKIINGNKMEIRLSQDVCFPRQPDGSQLRFPRVFSANVEVVGKDTIKLTNVQNVKAFGKKTIPFLGEQEGEATVEAFQLKLSGQRTEISTATYHAATGHVNEPPRFTPAESFTDLQYLIRLAQKLPAGVVKPAGKM
jgi:hypothetical protein